MPMSMRITVQPAEKCKLGNARTRNVTSQLQLQGDAAPNSFVTVDIRRALNTGSDECIEGTLVAVVVNSDGENHPYQLLGNNCSDGIYNRKFTLPSGEDKTVVQLGQIMVVACQKDKWSEMMSNKRRVLEQKFNVVIRDSTNLSPRNVKKFRINFYVPSVSPREISTREIEGVSAGPGPGAAATASASPSANSALAIARVLQATHCCVSSASIEMALIMRDSINDSAAKLQVACSICNPFGQPIVCALKKTFGHLVEVTANIPYDIEQMLNNANVNQFACQLSVSMETNGTVQSASSDPITFSWGCISCHQHSSALPQAAPYDRGHNVEPRRKTPGSGNRHGSYSQAYQQQQQQQQLVLAPVTFSLNPIGAERQDQPPLVQHQQLFRLLPPMSLDRCSFHWRTLSISSVSIRTLISTAQASPRKREGGDCWKKILRTP